MTSSGSAAQVGDERRPARAPDRRLEVVEDDLAALAIEIDGAAGGQEREVVLDLVDDRPALGVEDRAQAVLEAELAAVLADQVDDGQVALARRAAQPAAELLREHRRRRGRAQEQQAVDVGHVDALAEHLDREHAPQPPGPQRRCSCCVAVVRRVVAGQRDALAGRPR